MKYLVWIITIFLNVTGHHFLPKEPRRSRASLNNHTGYEKMSYVVVTGFSRNENAAKMEVIGPDGRTKICKGNNAAYPITEIESATATYTNDKIIVCGGWSPRTDECHVYQQGQGWTLLSRMAQAREASASIPIQGGILVTGGYDGSNILKTSQIVKLDGSAVTEGPEIPEERAGHCMTSDKEEDAFFLLGGGDVNIDTTSTVWQLEYNKDFILKKTTTMNKRRSNLGCAIFRSDQHGSRPLLVTAGSDLSGNGGNSCEFWDFTQPGSQWQLCSKELSVEMHGPRITATGKGDGLIMTYDRGIYKFRCDSANSCYFEKEDDELQIERRDPILLTVPTSFVENC